MTPTLDTLEKHRLGGQEQWLTVRGDAAKPLLLFLHGGPGSAEIGTARAHQRGLGKHFLVINWDQRGAGKSTRSGPPPESVAQLVADTLELTVYLLERFRQRKLYLVGHSWGSALGLLAAAARPDLYHAFVGSGQLVHSAEGEQLSYAYTLQRARVAHNRVALGQLERSNPPYGNDVDKLLTQRAWLLWFGGFFYRRSRALRYALELVSSHDYTLRDKRDYLRGSRGSLRALWPEVERLNLFEQVPALHVPLYFCVGRHDHTTPSELVRRYHDAVRAPCKELHWFEASGHFPHLEERERFLQILLHAKSRTEKTAE